jgi:hypothetical protein
MDSLAGFAPTPWLAIALVDVKVVSGQPVSVLADTLAGVSCWSAEAAQIVLGWCDYFKVAGVAARPVAAEVVELHPIGDRSYQCFVDNTMGSPILGAHGHDSIPVEGMP